MLKEIEVSHRVFPQLGFYQQAGQPPGFYYQNGLWYRTDSDIFDYNVIKNEDGSVCILRDLNDEFNIRSNTPVSIPLFNVFDFVQAWYFITGEKLDVNNIIN